MWYESDEFSKMKKRSSTFGDLIKYPFSIFVSDVFGEHIFHRIEVKQDLTTIKIFFSKYDVINGQIIRIKIVENPEYSMYKFKKQFLIN
jgi:hypothetical protein